MQFAFNSSGMPCPTQTRTLEPNEALKVMIGSSKRYETKFSIQNQQIELRLADQKTPSNSPIGGWMNLKIPIGSDQML